MVAKNVDTNDNTDNTDSYYSTGTRSHTPPTTYLYGRLPNAVITDLQRNYGTFYKVFPISNMITLHFRIIDFSEFFACNCSSFLDF